MASCLQARDVFSQHSEVCSNTASVASPTQLKMSNCNFMNWLPFVNPTSKKLMTMGAYDLLDLRCISRLNDIVEVSYGVLV